MDNLTIEPAPSPEFRWLFPVLDATSDALHLGDLALIGAGLGTVTSPTNHHAVVEIVPSAHEVRVEMIKDPGQAMRRSTREASSVIEQDAAFLAEPVGSDEGGIAN